MRVALGLATERAARAHIDAGSRWSAGLLAMVHTARRYVGRHGVPATEAAMAIAELVHAVQPAPRTLLNYTAEMRLAALAPQWVLDYAMQRMLQDVREQARVVW